MRLFVAIDLDDGSRAALARMQQQAAATLGRDRSLRWVDPSRMHLTLAFIGEISEGAGGEKRGASAIDPLVERFSGTLNGPPFPAGFRGFGVFPARGAPRVLWLGVEEGSERLAELQREVATELRHLRIDLDSRPFHPHLTLARWRQSGARPRPSDAARALAADPDAVVARVAVDHVTLYQSRLSPAGSTYVALARATLT
jgi:2'-5' RNA ligase